MGTTHRACNLYTKFVIILEICKQLPENLLKDVSFHVDCSVSSPLLFLVRVFLKLYQNGKF